MNKLKITLIASALWTSVVSAAPSCDGLIIRLRNNLLDDLLMTTNNLTGAAIQPKFFEKLKGKSEQILTINGTSEEVPMAGEIVLYTITLPSRVIKIQYTLENKLAYCEHTDKSIQSDYIVQKNRNIGEVQYSINN
ncbi:hypothetical protein BN59_01074 [Legionella massiliensis]|uniref:Uncharacterized protein n=1 Tax=Legionella massiliensis TaxID=1034943 RepID=A0A078KYH0_9GAMM|nr:hypothetical protein [Legionella massiliensis]CDZ76798.1 hypothetical protein BN59_01074 [Legionella massiliensis]CEE12536.1 hypothetical protein BN1094_01074 [Legionella massiliensis]